MESESPKELFSAFDSDTFGKDASFRLDKPVGSASISPCGRDIVLASRQGLHIIDLDSPWSPPRHLAHHTPWEVADVQWSPFAARDSWVVSTSNQKALVWNLGMVNTRSSVEHVLHAHSRAITDINFSAHHPDILSTCAVDSFVHCWDLRHPKRPAMSFCDWFAGATQVKWNRQDSHILASSHDKNLRIWDDRKGAYPLRSIEAHATKIYGVDWDRLATQCLVTCSLDKTIKVWDYTKTSGEPDHVIHTPFPVWRARHTPFGCGLLAMPQRGDHDLHLYDRRLDEAVKGRNQSLPPVHRFVGHQDHVKEFLWRPRGNVTSNVDDREFQLVSWGTDRLLRLHEVNEEVLSKVGYQRGMEVKRTINFTRRDATYKTFRDDPPGRAPSGSEASQLRFGPENSEDYRGMSSTSTVGVSRAALPFIGGYGFEGFMSSGTAKKVATTKEMDPISWMRGVRIGKRDASSTGLHQSASSLLSPGLKADPSWENFESLGEEITASGDKFPKVKFEGIDVQRRKMLISLSGPWAAENMSTYIKCHFSFPTNYPTSAAPKISLEKTASISDESLTTITNEVDGIANAFMSCQRNSLEAILRFLLGEQSKEESLRWLKKHRSSSDLNSALDPDLSSSDEDDEGLGKFVVPRENGLESSDPMLAVSNVQYNVPLPRTCGALWARNGILICFFRVKQEKDVSFLDQSFGNFGRLSKGRKSLFEGFGRPQNDSSRSKRGVSTLDTIESEGSDIDDDSSSSSGSSMFSDGMGPRGYHFMPTLAWRGNVSETRRDTSIDDSQKSSGDARVTSSSVTKTSMFISLHDITGILPSKRPFAREYRIGCTYTDAVHNAQVATEHGDRNLADVWLFVKMILQDKVPLNAIHDLQDNEDTMVVVRRSLSPLRSKDSAIDLSFDIAEESRQLYWRHPVKWGDHPFGRRWLVSSLLGYYERLGDLQMLAMLSIAFTEPSRVATKPGDGENLPNAIVAYEHRFFLPPKVDYSTEYYPSEEVALSILKRGLPTLSIPLASQAFTSGPQSATSSTGAFSGDPLAISSASGTPPFYRPLRPSFERKDSHTTSLSTSPEQHRQVHRSSSNLSAFATSFPRPFPFSQSAASSPPNTQTKKRTSPAGSYTGPIPSGISLNSSNWAVPPFFNRPAIGFEDAKTTYSVPASDTEEDDPPATLTKKPAFNVTLKNQDRFCNDGHANVSLLDPNENWKYLAWREAYADLLHTWEMPIARSEILSFNPESPRSFQTLPIHAALSTVGDIEAPIIRFTGHCSSCSAQLPSPMESNRCFHCVRFQAPEVCLFCSTYIRGLSSPCLQCGHTMHMICRAEVNGSGLFEECISGCGCNCNEYTSFEMSMPENQPHSITRRLNVSPAVTVIADSASHEQEQERQVLKENGDWEDVAYESLARNLHRQRRGSGRGLRATASQIWWGGQ